MSLNIEVRIALAGLLLGGCAQTHIPSSAELVAPTCDERGWAVASALAPGLDADYVGVRMVFGDNLSEFTDEHGERCAGVSDLDACESEIEYALDLSGPVLVVRRGADVSTVHGEGLVEALAPIDTVDEALLVAVVHGYLPPRCAEEEEERLDGGRSVEGGYQVVLIGDIACSPTGVGGEQRETYYRHLVEVRADGTLIEATRVRDLVSYCEDFCACRDVGG